ncbi:MAG: hypothetical protein U1F11_09050 [Steroidobacteraceae bacterium]
MQALFRERATDVRSRLPQFDPERIVGSNFDAYHVRPEHQRRVLAGLTGTHQGEFRIGNATLRVAATPVVDRGGRAHRQRGRVARSHGRGRCRGGDPRRGAGGLEGDLSQRVRKRARRLLRRARRRAQQALVGNMAGIVGQIQQAAGSVERSATEVSAGSVDLSSRTEQQGREPREAGLVDGTDGLDREGQCRHSARAEKLASAAFGRRTAAARSRSRWPSR